MTKISLINYVCGVLLLLLLAAKEGEGKSIKVSQCHPSNIDQIPARIQKICLRLLASIEELAEADQDYEDSMMMGPELLQAGVKRQESKPDHVFLRFGRG
ncbi:myosuppressin [Eurytemora carolleeae]|uniref:myosuppressin n=1 Tax=Eurytemora carolleeae TaxID=1294199 RepID=UPI000C785825|nr:myosuppressin [Eurytemora carolleeae]|eukprot:XP_023321871.1 myosuppressin-like [Eurytemora affinis]